MINKLRNPFRTRASEKLESDTSFLRLLSPEVLDSLLERHEQGKLWNNILFIRSSPGAGKTTLLRIFEPNVLTLIHNNRKQDYKELFNYLKRIEVLSEKSIDVLGVTIKCTGNYELLEELSTNETLKKRLFFALMNARIVLATLRSAVSLLKDSGFADGLARIQFVYDNSDAFLKTIATPCSGNTLFEWASDLERSVYKTIDSFLPITESNAGGHDQVFSFSILKPANILLDGKPIANKILFMIDDAHKLSATQRKLLIDYISETRQSTSIWISERLEALQNFRSFLDRDYNIINLENFWADNTTKYKKILANISEKRASSSTEDVPAFQQLLEHEMNLDKYSDKLALAIGKSEKSINLRATYSSKFKKWAESIQNFSSTIPDKAIYCKCVEILIERNNSISQLAIEFPLEEAELLSKIDNTLENTARLFLADELGLPYYFGFNAVVSISTNNIDQYLSFASELFEAMLTNKVLGKETAVNFERQDKLIRSVVDKRWKELSTLLPNASVVLNFLNNLGEFCRKVTFKPSASYAPGINGFAVLDDPLFQESSWQDNDTSAPFRDILAVCLAFNLLEVKQLTQGSKGKLWDVYFLNRWICVKFNLPLTYSGWNKVEIKELTRWLKRTPKDTANATRQLF